MEMRPHACGLLCGLCRCCGSSNDIDALTFYKELEDKMRMEIEQEQVNLQDKTIGEFLTIFIFIIPVHGHVTCTKYLEVGPKALDRQHASGSSFGLS